MLRQMGTPCLIHQPKYSMLERWVEHGLLDVLEEEGIGCIAFSPLAQGLLTSRYLNGTIPEDSRAAKPHGFLKPDQITNQKLQLIRSLNTIASERGQTLAQMALSWILKDRRVTSVLVGASRIEQLQENLAILQAPDFTKNELDKIEDLLKGMPS